MGATDFPLLAPPAGVEPARVPGTRLRGRPSQSLLVSRRWRRAPSGAKPETFSLRTPESRGTPPGAHRRCGGRRVHMRRRRSPRSRRPVPRGGTGSDGCSQGAAREWSNSFPECRSPCWPDLSRLAASAEVLRLNDRAKLLATLSSVAVIANHRDRCLRRVRQTLGAIPTDGHSDEDGGDEDEHHDAPFGHAETPYANRV